MNDETRILMREAESVLLSLCGREITAFSKTHRDETFYGFAFDCNLDYAEVLLCFNSENALTYFAENFSEVETRNRKAFREMEIWEKLGIDPPAEAEESPEDRRNRSRWETADWGYQGTDACGGHLLSAKWDQEWGPFRVRIHSQIIDDHPWDKPDQRTDATRNAFLEMLYRVLFALEATNAFAGLQKTPDFATLVLEHEDDVNDAWERIRNMRLQFGSEAPNSRKPQSPPSADHLR